MSNKRVEYSLEQAEIDVAVNYAGSRIEGIYPSQSLLSYQNVAVSLAKNNFKINSVYALTGKSVLAFQNATAFLPHPYKRVTTKLNYYEEVVNQAAQVDHLMKEWVDVVVLEKRVFLYYLQQYQQDNDTKEITIHPIFSEAARPAYFNNKVLQALFDMGLAHIKKSGEYNAIMAFDGTNYATVPDDGLVK
jgi:polar amino acid transport system substrate-binding protein